MNGRPPGRFDRRRPEQGLRINHRIRVPEIRVILEEEQLGIMPTHEALRLAEEKGLDLVEISPRAFPPVCRIMDYGKYKYEEAKKKQQQRKKASTVETKEIKFRPKTEEHDYAFKTKAIREFLAEGNKARVTVMFRGREITHREIGQAILRRIETELKDIAVVEQTARLEGRLLFMILAANPRFLQQQRQQQQAPGQPRAQPAAPRPGAPQARPPSSGPHPATTPGNGAPRSGPPSAPPGGAAQQAAGAPKA